MSNEYPVLDDLSAKDLEKFRKIFLNEKLEIEVNHEFHDDHLPCVSVTINGMKLGFWWLDTQLAGAFSFPDSPKAMAKIKTYIEDQLKFASGDGEDE